MTTKIKWDKEALIQSLKTAAEVKGSNPTSTDCENGLYGLPRVFNFYGKEKFNSFSEAISAAGMTPTRKPASKKARAAVSAGMKRRHAQNKIQSPIKKAVSDSLAGILAPKSFCRDCETVYVGEHTPEACRNNLTAMVKDLRKAAAIQ